MKRLLRCAAPLLIAVSLAAAAPPVLLAQAPNQTEEEEGGLTTRWALAYGLTGLGVVLGLVNVCRPGKRKGDPKKPT